jgi:hypothetical protein
METHALRRTSFFPAARVAGCALPSLALTPRDLAILRDLLRFGALTAEQLRRRHFPATPPGASTVTNRLRLLAGAGYVRTVPLGYHLHGAYLATSRGAAACAHLCGGLPAVRQREHAANVWLRHALAVADVADRLLAAGSYQGGEASWRTERELAREAAATGAWPYRPDGLLVLAAPDGTERYRMAVEVELTAKTPALYPPKLAWYADRLAAGGLHRVRYYVLPDGPAARAVRRATAAAGLPAGGVEVAPLPV